jgi:16S rRNA (guanine966-N2)-methyltransferase
MTERRNHPGRTRTTAQARGRHALRLIGGEWRGRRVEFPPVPAIRPTPDRVRETLFNWLQFDVAGARCLDLYAGSGALGLEALSRGAAQVCFVDEDADVVRHLARTLAGLGCDRGTVVRADAPAFLAAAAGRFDIVFLDPPYAADALADLCRRIEAQGVLRPGGLAYLEDAATRGAPGLPPGWTLLRSRRAGEVGYHLARRGPAADGK